MLCEGAVTILETNYADCIERAGHPERLPVVITDADRIDVDVAALLEAHLDVEYSLSGPEGLLVLPEKEDPRCAVLVMTGPRRPSRGRRGLVLSMRWFGEVHQPPVICEVPPETLP